MLPMLPMLPKGRPRPQINPTIPANLSASRSNPVIPVAAG